MLLFARLAAQRIFLFYSSGLHRTDELITCAKWSMIRSSNASVSNASAGVRNACPLIDASIRSDLPVRKDVYSCITAPQYRSGQFQVA